MAEILPIVLIVVLILLTIILSVVGVQIVLTLIEVRKTLTRVNGVLDEWEDKLDALSSPLKNFSGLVGGLQTGFKMFESFVGWLGQDKTDRK
ncbi:MAG TPA: hypothetical protein DEP87_01425 [Candidatus Pacebacteria bacterium]|nr:hypothetical protein [Candidatus Paceibacterota bacterium]